VFFLTVPRYGFAVENEGLDIVLGRLAETVDEIRVLCREVFEIATKDDDLSVVQLVDLIALAIVLVLARELAVLEAVEDLGQALGRMRQHRLDRDTFFFPPRGFVVPKNKNKNINTCGQTARILKLFKAAGLEKCRDELVVARQLTKKKMQFQDDFEG